MTTALHMSLFFSLLTIVAYTLNSLDTGSSQVSNKSKKTTKMMAVIMGTYYGVFIPLILNYQIPKPVLVNFYVERVLYIIFFLNGILNPIVYGWLSPDFNAAFRSLLGLKPNKDFQRSQSVSSVYNTSSHSQVSAVSAASHRRKDKREENAENVSG